MSLNTTEMLSQSLSLLTYNGDNIKTPKGNQLNMYMGIGLWSKKDGLSEGLPVDVMQMLLSATILRSQIKEANIDKPSKVIILIADSMAIREGAEGEKVSQLVLLYKKSLQSLLDLLNVKDSSEIVLSSDLEKDTEYQTTLKSLEQSSILEQLRKEDEAHYAYIRTQTAITLYMHTRRNVGIKVGWICADSGNQLRDRKIEPKSLKNWDELKFDRWCEAICPDSTIQCLYAKAGMKQSKHGKDVSVSEGCPYTAYVRDQRYIVQTHNKKEIKAICSLQKRVASHWKDVAKVCSNLMQTKIASGSLLPVDCIKKSNDIATVYNMLNHWSNASMLSSGKEASNTDSTLSSECSHILTAEESYIPMAGDVYVRILPPRREVAKDDSRVRCKCILL